MFRYLSSYCCIKKFIAVQLVILNLVQDLFVRSFILFSQILKPPILGPKQVQNDKRERFFATFTVLIFALSITACQSSASKEEAQASSSTSVNFSHKVEAEYAKGFRISYHENYKLLEILKPFQDKVDTLRYSLVPRKLMDEVEVPDAYEIPIPIRSLIATSTTHIGLAAMLEAKDIITGMVSAKYVYDSDIRRRLEQDKIVGFPAESLNKEKVVAMGPDVLMISGGQSSQFDSYRVLRESGIDVFVNAEWLETTPLGKAEWVKVLAALLDKEQLANERFGAIAKRYNRLKKEVDTVSQKPMVINSMPYKGAWFVSGGDSFVAQFLRDAGADYPWFDSEGTGGLRKDFEVVYEQGLKADIWLNPGGAETKEDILAKDSRFKEFKAFKTDEIYNNNKRKRPNGGNDYWESGVVHPEILLADLIKILHPQVVPDHQLYYYQKVD